MNKLIDPQKIDSLLKKVVTDSISKKAPSVSLTPQKTQINETYVAEHKVFKQVT